MTYPIPANDDSVKSVEFVAECLSRSAREGMEVRLGLEESRK